MFLFPDFLYVWFILKKNKKFKLWAKIYVFLFLVEQD